MTLFDPNRHACIIYTARRASTVYINAEDAELDKQGRIALQNMRWYTRLALRRLRGPNALSVQDVDRRIIGCERGIKLLDEALSEDKRN